jgi:proline iminopeptidase
MFESGKFQIPSGNIHLTADLLARPDSETVILLHGGPGVPDEMTEVRDWFSGHMQVVNFDQRGIGLSYIKSCTFTVVEFVNDIKKVADFFGIEKFHLFGHSWGGLYAQLFAAQNPERLHSLFLCSPTSGTGKIWEMTEKEIFKYNYERSSFREWLGMGLNTILGLLGNQNAYRNLFRQIIINYHKGYNVEPPSDEKLARISARAGTQTRLMIKNAPPLKNFGKTPYPVMVTYGEFDAYGVSKKYVYERFPFAKFTIIPDSGHTPWKHNLPEFQSVLRFFYGF